MGRGGYVCEGKLTHTPIDAAEDWTYEMVQCTGPIYNSYDYAALNAKLSRDELVKLNEALAQLNTTNSATLDNLNRQRQTLNSDLKATIEKQFQDLPHDVSLTAAIQNLKKNLLQYVDERLPPVRRSAPPTQKPPGPTSNQP
jgi:hypothetical protein